MSDLSYESYIAARTRLVRLGVQVYPVMNEAEYLVAEQAYIQAAKGLSDWWFDTLPLRDPETDPLGKTLWDEVTRWERIICV